MKRLLTLTALMIFTAMAWAQDVTYQVKYKYAYDMQKYEYIDSLDFAEGTILKLGDTAVVVNGERYDVATKDSETVDSQRTSTQYTTHNAKGEEYIICFIHELTYPEELAWQVVVFNANNPYAWQYYITDPGTKN